MARKWSAFCNVAVRTRRPDATGSAWVLTCTDTADKCIHVHASAQAEFSPSLSLSVFLLSSPSFYVYIYILAFSSLVITRTSCHTGVSCAAAAFFKVKCNHRCIHQRMTERVSAGASSFEILEHREKSRTILLVIARIVEWQEQRFENLILRRERPVWCISTRDNVFCNVICVYIEQD